MTSLSSYSKGRDEVGRMWKWIVGFKKNQIQSLDKVFSYVQKFFNFCFTQGKNFVQNKAEILSKITEVENLIN